MELPSVMNHSPRLLPTLAAIAALTAAILAHAAVPQVDLLWDQTLRDVNAGKLDDALGHAHTATEIAPTSVDAWRLLGWVYERRGEAAKAEAAYRQAIAFAPRRALLQTDLASALAREEKYEKAAIVYRRAIALDPDFTPARIGLALLLAEHFGKAREAVAEVRRAVRLRPEEGSYHNLLGTLLADYGQPEAAIEEYRAAIQLGRDDLAASFSNLGYALQDQGEMPEAVSMGQEAVVVGADPQVVGGAHNNLAYAFAYQGKWVQAAQEAKAAQDLLPDDSHVADTVGVVALMSGKLDDAETSLRRALSLPDPSASSRTALAWCLAKQGKPDEARRELGNAAREIRDEHAPIEVLFFAGKAYAELGQEGKALIIFQRAMKLYPKHPWSAEMRKFDTDQPPDY
jgi:tetratricopeptide (TPR) repeat protein